MVKVVYFGRQCLLHRPHTTIRFQIWAEKKKNWKIQVFEDDIFKDVLICSRQERVIEFQNTAVATKYAFFCLK